MPPGASQCRCNRWGQPRLTICSVRFVTQKRFFTLSSCGTHVIYTRQLRWGLGCFVCFEVLGGRSPAPRISSLIRVHGSSTGESQYVYIYINIRDASLFPATQSMQCRCYGSWSQPMSTLSVSNCRSMRLQCEWKVNRRTVWWLADTRTFTVKAKIVSRHDIPRAPDEQSPWQTPTNHLADSYGFWAAPLRALILARGRYCAQ